LSINPISASIDILRQRIFVDHSSKAKTFIIEEYTIRSNIKDVDNVLLPKTEFLPNLKIYDSDGEELPLMPNDLTYNIFQSRADQSSGEEKTEYENTIKSMADGLNLLWIKLPPLKKMDLNEIRVITLEYDAKRERKPTNKFGIKYERLSDSNVFYIIRKPEDYEFKKPKIETTTEDGTSIRFVGWEHEKNNLVYYNENFDSISITVKPEFPNPVDISYSFSANTNIISFPLIAVGMLSLIAMPLFILRFCDWFMYCINPLPTVLTEIYSHQSEFIIGIVGASLIIPGLIHNHFIRDSLKWFFLIPVFITLIILL